VWTAQVPPRTCAQLILDAGIARVVFALREPPIFVNGDGAERLRAAGVGVIEIPELAELVRVANGHLIPGSQT
jgi:pyrimidine deaminase RibD-like protein